MKNNGSLNRVYRLVWSLVSNTWVAVAETSRGRGKGAGRKLVAATLSLSAAWAVAGPQGGAVVVGTGSITQTGSTTTIEQSSQNLSLSWQSFNLGAQETVNFVQPTAAAVAINRIHDTQGSQILGQIHANGQVYLINPNGILFGQGSQINVGALVASTLDLADASLSSTARVFSGSGAGSVINQGSLNAFGSGSGGGYVAMVGNTVINEGSISAPGGTVALGAASATTLTFAGSSLIGMQIDQGVLDSLAQNKGVIQVNGGVVLMSAGARQELLTSVVNNTGVIEAQTVKNHAGTITLLAGMGAGTVHVGGTLDASAPTGGNGGFVETSAANLRFAPDAKVTTAAASGTTGKWLIDPTDFTIHAGNAGQTEAGMGADMLSSALGDNNVEIATVAMGSELGDINVNAAVTWSANQLTLKAHNDININANLNASGAAKLALVFGQTTTDGIGSQFITNGAAVQLVAGNDHFTTQKGSAGPVKGYTVITDAAALRAMDSSTHYALGRDIDLNSVVFAPIVAFNQTFDGLGHTISNVEIAGSTPTTGFFNATTDATIQNLGLVGGNVVGLANTGALVGTMTTSTVSNSYSTLHVTGNAGTGGLVGHMVGVQSQVISSYATGNVQGDAGTGGLVGSLAGNSGDIIDSFATGFVTGSGAGTGGLVGSTAASGDISNSFATGRVQSTGAATGGLVGSTADSGQIINSCAAGDVQGDGAGTGGLVGSSAASLGIFSSYATGNVMSVAAGTGGLVGSNTSGQIFQSFAAGQVNGGGAGTGGLAGSNTLGTISESFAVGHVSGSGYAISAPHPAAQTVGASTGGLVGSNGGTIFNAYAAGNVEGFAAGVGGLVGDNTGPISNSYAAGHVTGQTGATGVGGLRGFGTGTVADTNSFRLADNVTLNGGATAAPEQASTPLDSAGWAAFSHTTPEPDWGIAVWKMPASSDAYKYPTLKNLGKTLTTTSGSVSKIYDGTAYNLVPTLTPSCCSNGTSFMTVTAATLGQVNAGSYSIAPTVVLTNSALASYFTVAPVTLTITPKALSATATASNKPYDGTASANASLALQGLVDDETLGSTNTATFNSQNVGVATTVTVDAVTLVDGTGANAGLAANYSLIAGQTANANITAKALTVRTRL